MSILKIILIVVFLLAALAVTVIVLLQEGKSAGLGSLSGAGTSNDSYWDKNKKYSLEGKFEKWTKITAAVFVLSALVLMLAQSRNTKTTVPSTNTTTQGTTATEGKEDATASPEASDAASDKTADNASASPETTDSTSAAK